VVAVDVDGTMANYHWGMVKFICDWLGEDLHRVTKWDGIGEFSDHLRLDKETYRKIKLAYRAGGFKRWMHAMEDAGPMMRKLHDLGVEVWVTTTRPWMRMDNVDDDTKEWLRRNDIPYDYLLFDEDKYKRLTELVDAGRIVAVLDDEEEQRDRCAALHLPFVLRSTGWNYGVKHPGGQVVEASLMNFIPIVEERLAVRHALQH